MIPRSSRRRAFPSVPPGAAWPAWTMAAALGLALAPAAAAGGDLAGVKERGKLVALCQPIQNSPFVRVDIEAMRAKGVTLAEMRDPADFAGVDIDLLKGFAKSLGVPLEVRVVTDFEGEMIPGLLGGKGDVTCGILVNEERRRAVAFSEPFSVNWAVVAVPLQSKVTQLSDLAGKRGAGCRGSAQVAAFQAVAPPGVELTLTEFALDNYVEVLEGRADFALFSSSAAPGEPDAEYSELKVVVRLREVQTALALRPGSDLREPLDRWLREVKAAGELQRIFDRHGVEKSSAGRPLPPASR